MPLRYTVRLLSPDGQYPSRSIIADTYALLAVEELVWSAVHSPDFDEDAYPEGSLAWLSFDEVRFFSAVSLAEAAPHERARPWMISKTWSQPLVFDGDAGQDTEVDPEELLRGSRAIAEELAAREPAIPHVRAKPRLLERDYGPETIRLLHAIGTGADRLLHRGLYKFLMATELRRFPHLLEESAAAAYVSREAVIELLRRQLSDQRGSRLRPHDVLDHIRSVFPTGEVLRQRPGDRLGGAGPDGPPPQRIRRILESTGAP